MNWCYSSLENDKMCHTQIGNYLYTIITCVVSVKVMANFFLFISISMQIKSVRIIHSVWFNPHTMTHTTTFYNRFFLLFFQLFQYISIKLWWLNGFWMRRIDHTINYRLLSSNKIKIKLLICIQNPFSHKQNFWISLNLKYNFMF